MRFMALSLTILMVLAAPAQAQSRSLASVQHVLVIFMENRSFDGMFGNFPGASGLANAGAAAVQIDAQGQPYKTLPQPINSYTKTPDARFPGNLPNGPFEMSRYVKLDAKTGDLVHRFYQEQAQINGGAMNRFAEVSNAAGLVMAIMLAGLRGVDPEIWKATRIDGIPAWRTYLFIVLPMLKGSFATATILMATSVVRLYDLSVAMTNGGPGTATETITLYTYQLAFRLLEIGRASALGVNSATGLPRTVIVKL